MDTLSFKVRNANEVLLADGDLERTADFFTSDYVVHLTDGDREAGHDAIPRVLGALREAFPDLEVEVDVLVEAEDRIAWQRTFRGTQEGSYEGFPATGRPVVWRDMVTSVFRDGKIAEEWVVTDLAERLLRSRKG